MRRLGFSLAQAALWGALVGGLVYFRIPLRVQEELRSEDWTLTQRVRLGLQTLELSTYDWRAKELARASEPSEAVVVVAIDDEAIAHGRQSDDVDLATQPWSRQLLGGLFQQAVREGASVVAMDLLHPDLSPVKGASGLADDQGYRRLLDERPGKAVLAFSWTNDTPPPVTPPLYPFLMLVEEFESEPDTRETVRRILSERRPAYVVPEGTRVKVFAGVSDEGDATRLALAWGIKGPPQLRPRQVGEGDPGRYRYDTERLLVSLSEVQVSGLRTADLLVARSLQTPVAPLLGESSAYGSVRLRGDVDGRVRGVPHLINFPVAGRDRLLPSLALATAMRRANTRQLRYENGRLWVGDELSVPMEPSGISFIRWDAPEPGRRSKGTLKRDVSAWSLVENLQNHRARQPPRHDNELKERIVVLTQASSLSPSFRRTSIGERVPMGAIHGQAIANLLRSSGITRASNRTDFAATVLCAFVGAFLALTLSGRFRSALGAFTYFGSALVAAAIYVYVAWAFFVREQLWLAMAGPLVAMGGAFALTTVHAFRTERQLRDFVSGVLGRYVNPEVAKRVRRDLTNLRPERREMTILFADIDGFTRLSEALSPQTLVSFLGEYLTEMTDVIRGNSGQVDKYMGDSLLAFWGAPIKNPRHVQLACQCVLQMRDVLARRAPEWEKRYGHRIDFRVGLNTGKVVVGDMGSEHKSNYTVAGAAVNLAWWLEGANKHYGTFILTGEATAEAASEQFVFREVDRVRLPTPQQGTRMFELLGARGAVPPEKSAMLELYLPALTAYQERKFEEALALFTDCANKYADPVAALYVIRCRQHLAWPPAESWDGLHEPKSR